MTLVTVTNASVIVSPRTAYEGSSGMTGMAIQSRLYMDGIGLSSFTFCRHTIMTGRAVIDDASMIEDSTDETTGSMTGTTILNRWNMTTCFTSGERTIMTGAAVVHDTHMIESSGHKTCGLMTIAAITVGWYMVWWGTFSSGGYTIVA